jgi:hypothetical protein
MISDMRRSNDNRQEEDMRRSNNNRQEEDMRRSNDNRQEGVKGGPGSLLK